NFEPGVLDALGRRTAEAVKVARTRNEIMIADEAKPLWTTIYTTVEGTPPTNGLIDHLTARAAPQMLRLAMLYALLDGAAKITALHIDAAHALWRCCCGSGGGGGWGGGGRVYIYSTWSNERAADTFRRALQSARPDGYNRREFIHDVFGRNVDAYAISCALRTLEAAGKIRCEKNKPNGR